MHGAHEGSGHEAKSSQRALPAIDRLPPAAIESEENVLANAVHEPPLLPDIVSILPSASMFWTEAHQALYAAILGRFNAGKPISPELLANDLVASGNASLVDPTRSDLFNRIFGTVHFEHSALENAHVVKQKHVLRLCIEAANMILGECYGNRLPPEMVLHFAMEVLNGLAESQIGAGTVTFQDVWPEVLETYERRKKGEVLGVVSGLTGFDSLTGGFQEGELAILAARPSVGKTALALNICQHATDMGAPVLFVSLEMTKRELTSRLMSARACLDNWKLRNGVAFDDDEYRRLQAATRAFDEAARIHFLERPNSVLPQLVSEIRAAFARHRVRLIVVDYLQLVSSGDKRDNETASITKVSGAMKSLARDLRVPVLALSQLNRESEKQAAEEKEPRLHHLRGSGSLEQDADIVLFLHRPNSEDRSQPTHNAKLILAKMRNGQVSEWPLTYTGRFYRFEEKQAVTGEDFRNPQESY